MKHIISLILLFLYVIGTVNGIGYSIYIGEWPTAISVAVLSVMAFPTTKYHWKKFVECPQRSLREYSGKEQ